MKAIIVYHSKTGHTREAAEDIARGLAEKGVDCTVTAAGELSGATGDISGYDIVLVGTPTYGNRRYRLPAKPVEQFLGSLGTDGLKGKVTGAFTVNAGAGGSKLVPNIEAHLSSMGGKVVTGGPVVRAGAILSLWTGPAAKPADREKCVEFGRRVAAQAG
jgi:menaquinone-dependent protoporphyrinogen IX oxidase